MMKLLVYYSKIIPTSVEELLGVTINNSLCWDNHIRTYKCNSFLFLLSTHFCLGKNELYFTMPVFFPIYCCIIWYNCTSSLEDIIVKFQKRAAILILEPDFKTPSK